MNQMPCVNMEFCADTNDAANNDFISYLVKGSDKSRAALWLIKLGMANSLFDAEKMVEKALKAIALRNAKGA